MTEQYMSARYKSGGRGEAVDGVPCYDCWGLTRAVRAEVYGLPWLPSFAQARHGRSGSIQGAYIEQAAAMQQCPAREGAVAAVLRRGVCVHVAVVVSGGAGLRVLEIKREGCRARLMPLADWLRDYPAPLWEVRFYD